MPFYKTNTSALHTALKQKGWLQETDQWNEIVGICEGVLFSPVDVSASKEELLQVAEEFMQRIDSRLNR